MNIIDQFFTQYSTEFIIIFIISIGVAIKFASELYDFFYNKIHSKFESESSADREHHDLVEMMRKLEGNIDDLKSMIDDQNKKIDWLQEQTTITTERLQEDARSYIIDKHHYFCYEIGKIDDLSLQSLERRYVYYKNAGGNSFIDGLMEEIRALPRAVLKSLLAESNEEVTQ